MKNEFFGSREKFEANDFSTQSILGEIERARRGSEWTTTALRRAYGRARRMLDAADRTEAPIEVLVAIGEEEDGRKVFVEEDNRLHAVNPREGTVLLGEVEEFALKARDKQQGLYMAMSCQNMGGVTCWVPVARAGEQGFALRMSGLADPIAYEDPEDVWAGSARYNQAVGVQLYRDIADSILFDTANTTPEQILEEIEDLIHSGPVDLDQLTTDMNLAIQEGTKYEQELYVDLSGEVELADDRGDWHPEYLTDQEYKMVGIDIFEASWEEAGFGAYAYLQTYAGKIVRADMHESNFIIGVGDYVDDDISDDTFGNE